MVGKREASEEIHPSPYMPVPLPKPKTETSHPTTPLENRINDITTNRRARAKNRRIP
jgi:hypothetical protein